MNCLYMTCGNWIRSEEQQSRSLVFKELEFYQNVSTIIVDYWCKLPAEFLLWLLVYFELSLQLLLRGISAA